jgi:hypothetical protein
MQNFYRAKWSPKMPQKLTYIIKKLPKNVHPIGEKLPNLVTLIIIITKEYNKNVEIRYFTTALFSADLCGGG